MSSNDDKKNTKCRPPIRYYLYCSIEYLVIVLAHCTLLKYVVYTIYICIYIYIYIYILYVVYNTYYNICLIYNCNFLNINI